MAFRSFRYHPRAEAGLKALLARGDDAFEELKRQIRRVQDEWKPQGEDDVQYVVPFHGFSWSSLWRKATRPSSSWRVSSRNPAHDCRVLQGVALLALGYLLALVSQAWVIASG